MKLGDRVKILNSGNSLTNCEGILIGGQTGILVAKEERKHYLSLPSILWVVLFDNDICGLFYKPCKHNFWEIAETYKGSYQTVEGAILFGKRNQLYFREKQLQLLLSISQPQQPKDNDGRAICFWCGKPTKKILGFHIKQYDFCDVCKK
jgi:hypothetical protein